MKKIFFIFITLTFLFSAIASAEVLTSWRCGNLLIEQGIQDLQVQANCGEPMTREVIGRTSPGDEGGLALTIEKWTYGPEAGYYYVLYFSGGVLQKVESIQANF